MTLAVSLAMAVQLSPTLTPVALRTEYLENPVGIDVAKPRFTWKLDLIYPELKNRKQTSYQILVASDPDLLAKRQGDMWDSKIIKSNNTVLVEYEGKPLLSGRSYWWSVGIFDGGGPQVWSEPAQFSMGLLSPGDWKAKWIGFDEPLSKKAEEPSFRGAKWIWHPDDEYLKAPAAARFFWTEFTVPAGVKKAELMATADDQFSLTLNGQEVAKSDGKTDAWQRPVTANVLARLKEGANELKVKAENTGNGGAGGLIVKLSYQKADGSWTHVTSAGHWKSSVTEGGESKLARELFNYGDGPWGWFGKTSLFLPPPRYFRKEFSLGKPIKRATLYGSALGIADFHLNGKKVGDEYFLPGWTEYEKRVLYRAFDVTKQVKRGANALGALLGDGWWAGYVGYGGRREHYGEKTRVLAQLVVDYADGTQEIIATGTDWKAGLGPILESDFLMGEAYDAQKEMPGWDKPGFKDSSWKVADVTDSIKAKLEAFNGVPVRAYEILRAKSISQPKPVDAYVLDLGQNMAGFARIKAKGKKGQKLTLRFAERLNPDGTIYTTNLRGARTIDTYTFKGNGVEEWEPRFTFHGFQYIEVSGLGRKPTPNEVVGVAISSDTPDAYTWESGDPMLNKLVRNAYWTQRMNFIDIPTDCPQRDERLGWTGDAQAYIRTATYLTDVGAFFTKWLQTLQDSQRADGQFPMVSPVKVAGDDGGPAWADAGVICPWTIYDVYGDKRQLAQRYDSMKKFVEFYRARGKADFMPPDQFHCFGDWVSINANTPTDVIYVAYFAYSAFLTAEAARELGLPEDEKKYRDLFEGVKATFNKNFVADDGKIKGDTQCVYVMAISFDLLPPEMRAKAAERLVADIDKRGGLSTGFVGTRDIMHALTKIGRNDVALRLLHSTAFPSWGFTIKNGATSIWERWDGWTPEKGFQDPGMNSFAHYAFGAVVGWMYDQLPGIRPLEPGYAKVRIAPIFDPQTKWLKASYDSIRGRIVSEWKFERDKVTMRVVMPPNVEAEIWVPGANASSVTAPSGMRGTYENSFVVFKGVGSGEHRFESKIVSRN